MLKKDWYKELSIPKKLYKYCRISDYTIDSFEKKEVYCATLNEYNDPYEGYFYLNKIVYIRNIKIKTKILENIKDSELIKKYKNIETEDELLRFIEAYCPENLNYIKEYLKELKDTNKFNFMNKVNRQVIKEANEETLICSFSEENNNILMWSHYAQDHSGFCIEYDTSDFKEFLYKVNYSQHIINPSDIFLHDVELGEITPEDKKTISVIIATTKNNCWQYEKEWRIVFNKEDDKNNYSYRNGKIYYKLKPKALYLGTQTEIERLYFKLIKIHGKTLNQIEDNNEIKNFIKENIDKLNNKNLNKIDDIINFIDKEKLDLNNFISINKKISELEKSSAEKLYNELNNELEKIKRIKKLIEISKKNKIPIYQMKMAYDKYELTAYPYS